MKKKKSLLMAMKLSSIKYFLLESISTALSLFKTSTKSFFTISFLLIMVWNHVNFKSKMPKSFNEQNLFDLNLNGVCKKTNAQRRKTRQVLCHNEYDRHTIQTNLVVFHYQLSNLMVECSLMCRQLFSHWLANFIKGEQLVLEILKMAETFLYYYSFSVSLFFYDLIEISGNLIWWPKISKKNILIKSNKETIQICGRYLLNFF